MNTFIHGMGSIAVRPVSRHLILTSRCAGELLWVYEGLTQYLGKVLPARSGLWSAEDFREAMAAVAAEMEKQSGREWRPLVDTAVAVQFTYPSASSLDELSSSR